MLFFVFTLVFAMILYLHFYLGHRTWRTIRRKPSAELDMGYVRLEDYFGQSFRNKLKDWLKEAPASEQSGSLRIIDRGRERVFITSSSASYPSAQKETELLVIEGEFQCGADCRFEKEIFVHEDCEIGSGTHLQAIAVDGGLILGDRVQVRRWVDAHGYLEIQEECRIESRVTSRTGIRFGEGSAALSLFAPEVITEGRQELARKKRLQPARVVEIPHSDVAGGHSSGYDARKLFFMGGESYLYDGDLRLTVPVHVKSPLVVRGDFYCPPESLLDADIKAYGLLEVGSACIVRGNLVTNGDLILGADTFFQGILHAGGTMRLRHGVRGLRENVPVAAYSAGPLLVESNVVVNGKLASASHVKAVAAPVVWLAEQDFRQQMERK